MLNSWRYLHAGRLGSAGSRGGGLVTARRFLTGMEDVRQEGILSMKMILGLNFVVVCGIGFSGCNLGHDNSMDDDDDPLVLTATPQTTSPAVDVSPTPERGSPTPDITQIPLPTLEPGIVAQAVDQVSPEHWDSYVRQLSGEDPFVLGDTEYTIHTRYAYTTEADNAAYYLQQLLTEMGLNVALQAFNCAGASTFNVVATLPGRQRTADRLVVGGHYDSISTDPYNLAPGADDNASGAASVLEAARVLSHYQPARTIDFVLFGAEEISYEFCGSSYYLEQAQAHGEGIEGAIVLDMVGYYENYDLDVESEKVFEDWVSYAVDAAAEFTDLATHTVYGAWGSDHVTFIANGIPAYLLIEDDWEHPQYHTVNDTWEHMNPEIGYDATRIAVAVLAEQAVISE